MAVSTTKSEQMVVRAPPVDRAAARVVGACDGGLVRRRAGLHRRPAGRSCGQNWNHLEKGHIRMAPRAAVVPKNQFWRKMLFDILKENCWSPFGQPLLRPRAISPARLGSHGGRNLATIPLLKPWGPRLGDSSTKRAVGVQVAVGCGKTQYKFKFGQCQHPIFRIRSNGLGARILYW